MNRIGFGKRWIVCVVLVAGGCGAFPDSFVDTGRDALKKTLEKVVEEAVEQVVNEVVDDLWELSDASDALEADGEG